MQKRNNILEVEDKFLDYFRMGMKYTDISNILNISKTSISIYIKNNGLINPSKIDNINHNAFSKQNEESIYWLGFLWADGSIQTDRNHYTLELEIMDEEHAEKFKKFINAKKITKRNRNNSTTFRVNISSKQIILDLLNFGFDIKDNRVNLPNIDNKYLRIFLRGYFDGDGHIRIKNEKFEAIDISGREVFIDNIYNTFPYFIRKEKHSTRSLRIYTNKEFGLKFLKYIYKDANIYLERKYNSALFVCEHEVIKLGKIGEGF